jgi:hypothetical protein
VASVLEEWTGRHCLFVPRDGLALYLTLRTLAVARRPHPDVPLDDHVIPFVMLAAGLRCRPMQVSEAMNKRKLSGRPVAWESCPC